MFSPVFGSDNVRTMALRASIAFSTAVSRHDARGFSQLGGVAVFKGLNPGQVRTEMLPQPQQSDVHQSQHSERSTEGRTAMKV